MIEPAVILLQGRVLDYIHRFSKSYSNVIKFLIKWQVSPLFKHQIKTVSIIAGEMFLFCGVRIKHFNYENSGIYVSINQLYTFSVIEVLIETTKTERDFHFVNLFWFRSEEC